MVAQECPMAIISPGFCDKSILPIDKLNKCQHIVQLLVSFLAPIVPLDQVQGLGLAKVPYTWMVMCQVTDFVSQTTGNKDLSSLN